MAARGERKSLRLMRRPPERVRRALARMPIPPPIRNRVARPARARRRPARMVPPPPPPLPPPPPPLPPPPLPLPPPAPVMVPPAPPVVPAPPALFPLAGLPLLPVVAPVPLAPPPPPPVPPAPAFGTAAAVLQRFPTEQVVDVHPTHSPYHLRFIGKWVTARFRERGYRTLAQILRRISQHQRTSNTTWLQNIVTNERAGQCLDSGPLQGRKALVPLPLSRAARVGRAPHGYRVPAQNFRAYNSIVTYARMHAAAGQLGRVPLLLRVRTALAAYPDTC